MNEQDLINLRNTIQNYYDAKAPIFRKIQAIRLSDQSPWQQQNNEDQLWEVITQLPERHKFLEQSRLTQEDDELAKVFGKLFEEIFRSYPN